MLRQAQAVLRIVGRHGLLKEQHVFLFAGARHFQGRGIIPGVVGVDAQRHVGSDGLAHRVNPRDVLLHRRSADLDLYGLKTHLHIPGAFLLQFGDALALLVIPGAGVGNERMLGRVQQFVHRHGGRFAQNVP